MQRLTIGKRLALILGSLVLLVAVLSSFNLWTTGRFQSANRDMSTALERAARVDQENARLGQWLLELNQAQADHNTALRQLGEAILANHATLKAADETSADPLGRFLASQSGTALLQQLGSDNPLVVQLQTNRQLLLEAEQQLIASWRPRHAGLIDALNELKRNYIYWALKMANAIFIKSSVLELVPDELEATPLEQFADSSTYATFAPQFPELANAVEKTHVANRLLYEGADQLGMVILKGDWEAARKLFRDVFPPQIKSLVVDLDAVIHIEQAILADQQRALDILNTQLATANHDTATALAGISEELTRLISAKRGDVEQVATEISTVRTEIDRTILSQQRLSIVALVFGLPLALLFAIFTTRSISRPLVKVVGNLQEIARGQGDLTSNLDVRWNHEVGDLARNFNRFIQRLREMVLQIRQTSGEVQGATSRIRGMSGQLAEGAASQSSALHESYAALKGIEGDVEGIVQSSDQLTLAVRDSSSATLELGAASEEIERQMQRLFSAVENVSASTQSMSTSSQQIASSVGSLTSETESAAAAMTQLEQHIREIESTAEKSKQLSQEAAQDAHRGREQVASSIAGIGRLAGQVEQAAGVINRLGQQSIEIGTILKVIDEVADQTSLLALNATIIAAQAGQHGKGFSVVAEEIRELAVRTARSTQEISMIIDTLQGGVREAVTVIEASRLQATEEAERSATTGQALDQIKESADQSMQQVLSIAHAAHEQATGSRQVNLLVQQVREMLLQVATAINQQNQGIDDTALATRTMQEIAGQVKHSTREQSQGSKLIARSMEQIEEMISRIHTATSDQSRRSKQVVEAVASIRLEAENNRDRTSELEQIIEQLETQSMALEKEVGAFKVSQPQNANTQGNKSHPPARAENHTGRQSVGHPGKKLINR